MNPTSFLFANGRKIDDWCSPILVKELRQGMRGRAFLLSFLLIQLFLVILVLGNLAAQGDRATLDNQNSLFWVILGLALLVLMPLRGLNAISQELRRQTMEVILLTRLTAWRVVFGKWSALFAQSLLLVSAVLPYIVIRYFIGGQDVVSDFTYLLFMLWLSGLLIAAAIAISAITNMVVRILLVLFTLWGMGYGSNELSGSARGMEPWLILLWLVLYGFFIPALLFELTASRISPAPENHAARRRLIALAFFLIASFVEWLTPGAAGTEAYIPLLTLVGICYFDLSEKPVLLARFVQTLSKYGRFGRALGIFFFPGWPSAFLFSLVVIPLAMGVEYLATNESYATPHSSLILLLIFAIFGSVMVPILFCHLCWRKMDQVALMIALYNIMLSCLTSILNGFASLTHVKVDYILAFAPSLPVFMQNLASASDDQVFYVYGLWNTVALSLLLVVFYLGSRRYFRELIALYRSTAERPSIPAAAKAEAVA